MTELKTLTGTPFNRTAFESLLKRRLFYTESFGIYRTSGNLAGDSRGLYDYGPPGCALQYNIVDLWRKHFEVFKTSGHVDKFEDWMCKDSKKVEDTGTAKKRKGPKVSDVQGLRLNDAVDKEYEEILAKIDNYDGPELGALIEKYDIRNPDRNTPVLPRVPSNLMFKTTLGPSSAFPGYLRPETAQGQFLNFKKFLEYNQNSMPFASASISKSFRNEISPRSGLLRNIIVDPEGGKKHLKFGLVKDLQLRFLKRSTQLAGKVDLQTTSLADAVSSKMVDNETLGLLPQPQHMANEMAHYATDCWDVELLTSYGWIECVGCADRSAYNLTVHSKKTGESLVKNAKAVEAALTALTQAERETLATTLDENGAISISISDLPGKTEISQELVSIIRRTRFENVREYIPNVIEPSFGIGRIFYSLLEHVYWHRHNDTARGVLSLPISVAPTKVLIAPLSTHPEFAPLTLAIAETLRAQGISVRTDNSSASIGKRYARNDELGIPLGITVDFDSVKNGTITLRERDSTKQVRASQEDIFNAVISLIDRRKIWEDVFKRLPEFLGQSGDE
ncbi:hypothetical protein BDW74DRAFT_180254 [Aspergillus multicolor]|uniref:uncharacterized protein n=1 Tax=Aspergillus multicolor TaxID=41759 RepID=UPI003CCE5145